MRANLALNLRNLGVGNFQPIPRREIPCKFQSRQDSPSSVPSKNHTGLEAKQYLESNVADQHSLLTLTCLLISKPPALSASPAEASHSLHAKAVGHLSPRSYPSGFFLGWRDAESAWGSSKDWAQPHPVQEELLSPPR